MTTLSRRLALAATASLALASPAAAQSPGELVKIIEKYAAALKAKDVEALVGLYAGDGVFMPENMEAAVGTAAVRAAYTKIFTIRAVDLAFTVQEAEISGNIAWLRATSAGRVKLLATGKETEEAYNTLVVFHRVGDAWKIRAYSFALNRPGP
jgi:uncharacterized protein (TIGR02246 family)